MKAPPPIEKCAAVIIRDRRLLVVRKRATDLFISPGGKRIAGETERACLARELLEELTVELTEAVPFGIYERPSAFEPTSVRISAWLTGIRGECRPSAEIEELRWIAPGDPVRLGSVFGECVIPDLVARGLL